MLQQFTNRKHLLKYKRNSKLNWPRQNMPSIQNFSTWNTIIKQIAKANTNGQLTNKLGQWLVNPSEFCDFSTMVHKTKNNLLIKENGIWRMVNKSHSVGSTTYYTKSTRQVVSKQEMDIHDYCTVNVVENKLFFSINKQISENMVLVLKDKINRNIDTNILSLNSFIGSSYNIYKNLLGSVQSMDDKFIRSGTYRRIKMCSNSGSKDNKGSIGVILKCDNKISIRLSSQVPEI
jgi:hypothetical protein